MKGYSKLAKEGLIAAILEKRGLGTSLEHGLATSSNKLAPDPATEQFLQRTSTKIVYSRDESEARIEKNKDLVAKRAEMSGVAVAHASDNEAGAQLVKTTTSKGKARQQSPGNKPPRTSPVAHPAGDLASTLSAAREARAEHGSVETRQEPAPSPTTAPAPGKKGKLVVQASQIQKAGSAPAKSLDQGKALVPESAEGSAPVASPDSSPTKKTGKAVAGSTSTRKSMNMAQAAIATAPAPAPVATPSATKPGKVVVQSSSIQKISTPSASQPESPPEPKEPRFQDLPIEDRERALKNVSKNVIKLLKMRKPDFLKKKAKDLEKFLELLEVEKGRFTVYRPTDKALRGFIDESIALINQVKEEQLNQVEQHYINRELPQIIKKNEAKIKQYISRIDRYYSDMDAARDIVEKFIKKSPFPATYLITVILQKIRDKAL